MSEDLARYYFKQFMEGLDHCHTAGVSHRDLKPENLLLGEDYNLKLADFGYAAPVTGRDGTGYLETHCGTMGYMAPEIHLRQKYNGQSVDLFSAAIILFIMVAQHPPFVEATNNDIYYKCLAVNRADLFWMQSSKGKPEGFFSEDFKDLIQSCLQLSPFHRPTLAEVMAHPWMTKHATPTYSEVTEELHKRMQIINAQVEQEQESRNAEQEEREGEVSRGPTEDKSNKFNLRPEDI